MQYFGGFLTLAHVFSVQPLGQVEMIWSLKQHLTFSIKFAELHDDDALDSIEHDLLDVNEFDDDASM